MLIKNHGRIRKSISGLKYRIESCTNKSPTNMKYFFKKVGKLSKELEYGINKSNKCQEREQECNLRQDRND